jgi:hypothetical protein
MSKARRIKQRIKWGVKTGVTRKGLGITVVILALIAGVAVGGSLLVNASRDHPPYNQQQTHHMSLGVAKQSAAALKFGCYQYDSLSSAISRQALPNMALDSNLARDFAFLSGQMIKTWPKLPVHTAGGSAGFGLLMLGTDYNNVFSSGKATNADWVSISRVSADLKSTCAAK